MSNLTIGPHLSPLSPSVNATVQNRSFIEHFQHTRAHGKKYGLFLLIGQSVSCFFVFSLVTLREIRAVAKQKERKKWGVFHTERLMDQKQIIGNEFSIYLRLLTVYLFYV